MNGLLIDTRTFCDYNTATKEFDKLRSYKDLLIEI